MNRFILIYTYQLLLIALFCFILGLLVHSLYFKRKKYGGELVIVTDGNEVLDGKLRMKKELHELIATDYILVNVAIIEDKNLGGDKEYYGD